MVDFSKYKSQEESQEEKKISKVQKSITPKKIDKKSLLQKKLDTEFSNINISQDDLWILYRLKFNKGTREKRSLLLPKFTEVFTRNLNEIKNKD